MSMWTPDFLEKVLTYSGLAAIGGVSRYRMRKDGEPKTIGRTLLEAFVAGFVGLLAFQICAANGMSQEWTAVISGTSGYIGPDATIGLFSSIIWQKFGLTKKEDAL